jgi:hypothetical protein
MQSEWSWGHALDLALSCDCEDVEKFLLCGSVPRVEAAAFAVLDISGGVEKTRRCLRKLDTGQGLDLDADWTT